MNFARNYRRTGKILLQLILAGSVLPAAAQQAKVDTIDHAPAGKPLKQIVYKVNPWVTIPLDAVMTIGNFYAIPNILHAKKEISPAEIAALRPELLSSLDRWAVEQDPNQRDWWYKFSDVGLPVTVAASLSILLDDNIRKDGWKVALMFYEAQAVTFTIYNYSPLGPAFQNRLRPLVYYSNFDPALRQGGGQRNSMFSGHTANAAAATFFAVKVYSDYHPEVGRKKYLWYALASLPPLVIGYSRVKALAHFPSDVFLGLLVGATSGIAIPALHKVNPKTVQFGVTYNEFGAGLGATWRPAKKHFKARNAFTSAAPLALH
ncbi:phosphatase PAP2 family protein [Flaviaesturariibacter terrae]